MKAYLISGIGASVCSVLYYTSTAQPAICIGASGAIFGILGAYITLSLLGQTEQRSVSYPRLILCAALMLVGGMQLETIDNAAHLGGMVIGSIIAYIYCICKKNKI